MSHAHKNNGYTDYKRERRTKHTTYECPLPSPDVLQCSVCRIAEQQGANLWNCLPFVSYSTFYGPILGDILIHILNLLPTSIVSCLGIAHEKLCRAKVQNGNCPPDLKKNKDCTRVCAGRSVRTGVSGPGESEGVGSSKDSLTKWMHDEYVMLAQELADIKQLTCEEETHYNQDLMQARNYILDRLAEMLAKREEIEKRAKKKKNHTLS